MADSVLDRETLLDVSVNVVPLGILVFFTVLLLVSSSYPPDPFVLAVAVALHLIPFVFLALLTYAAAYYI